RQFLEIGIDGGKVEQQVAEVLARRCVNALQFVDEGFVQGGGRRKISEELPGVRTRRVGEKPVRTEQSRDEASRDRRKPRLPQNIKLVDAPPPFDHAPN